MPDQSLSLKSIVPDLIKLGVSEAQISNLQDYLNLLWRWNDQLNLFSRQMTSRQLIDNHLLDCILPFPYLPKNLKKIADLGSGGGLPAIIFSILLPDTEFTLYEKSPKKQSFLKECQKTFKLNLSVQGLIPSVFPDYDLVTARAFKPIDVILDLTQSKTRNKTKYFLLKGKKETFEPEIALARKKFKFTSEVIRLESPRLEVERHLVLIET